MLLVFYLRAKSSGKFIDSKKLITSLSLFFQLVLEALKIRLTQFSRKISLRFSSSLKKRTNNVEKDALQQNQTKLPLSPSTTVQNREKCLRVPTRTCIRMQDTMEEQKGQNFNSVSAVE